MAASGRRQVGSSAWYIHSLLTYKTQQIEENLNRLSRFGRHPDKQDAAIYKSSKCSTSACRNRKDHPSPSVTIPSLSAMSPPRILLPSVVLDIPETSLSYLAVPAKLLVTPVLILQTPYPQFQYATPPIGEVGVVAACRPWWCDRVVRRA